MKEYKVTVSMTEHTHDNAEAPYYWSLLVWEDDAWCSAGSGWGKTPEDAFAAACACFEERQ